MIARPPPMQDKHSPVCNIAVKTSLHTAPTGMHREDHDMPDPLKPLKDYAKDISANLARHDSTEHTHRAALAKLIESLFDGTTATNEPKRSKVGAPDYIITKGQVSIGHIEAKDIGKNLREIERDEQLKRYRASLPNLILTDYVEFRWYTDGEFRAAATLGSVTSDSVKATKEGVAQVHDLLSTFMQHRVPSVGSPRELACRMAHLARMIRDITTTVFEVEEEAGTLHSQFESFKQALLPTLTPAEFADMFAQTIAYGLFAARHGAPRPFTRQNAVYALPKTNPFLQKLFGHMAGVELDDRVAWVVDDLAQVLADADIGAILQDFGNRTRKEDPVVHFYETFLQEYNPKQRELRGVYYTPEPVVSYIVRSVDHLLRTKFDKPLGLADPNVMILDPACGTGTFLFYVVKLIHERLVETGQAGGWNDYVEKHLLPRLFGFELLMAPYAIAHLKLGLLLEELGYKFQSDQRLGVYLTNTLEPGEKAQKALGFAGFITEEANAATDVKQEKPIMVVLGNPPYSGHSANKGAWIDGLLKGRLPDGKKVPNYYEVDGQPLGERNPKWLQDDYVKFIRFGQWRIDQTGYGILAFVTSHSYLDGPTFRGMRQSLMRTFTEIKVMDLHGNSKKKERTPDGTPDKNVFDIQQGVAIGLLVKEKDKQDVATVEHADLWGVREAKYATLNESDISSTRWNLALPESPFYLYDPRDVGLMVEYNQGWRIADAMPVTSVGIATARDDLTIHWTAAQVLSTVRDFEALPAEEARSKYELGEDARDWKVGLAQEDIRSHGIREDLVAPVLYRPFDPRFTYYTGHSRGFICMPRGEVMRHMLGKDNVALSTIRSVEIGRGWEHVFCSNTLIGHHTVSVKEVNYLLPVYLYPTQEHANVQDNLLLLDTEPWPLSDKGRRPNLSPEFVADMVKQLGMKFITDGKGDLQSTFGPEDVFHYIYALFHSPTYRARYAEFLKIDFPRVPLTSNPELFRTLAALGEELVSLHLMESPALNSLLTSFPVAGTDEVAKVEYFDIQKRVKINNDQYFEGVEPEVWEFHIGGYQVLQKWLKDRKGRKLTWEDQQHYQRIVVALTETMRLMKEIDETIPSWPIA